MELSAAILAGGRSMRMGRDKAAMPFHGRPMIETVIDRLRTCSDDVFVVAKEGAAAGFGTRLEVDRSRVTTPLAGVVTALESARHPAVFVCGCDMPFVEPGVVAHIAAHLGDHDVAVPITAAGVEPLHSVWRSGVAEAVALALHSGERAVHRVLARLDIVEVRDWARLDPEGRSFLNVNTPADAERLA